MDTENDSNFSNDDAGGQAAQAATNSGQVQDTVQQMQRFPGVSPFGKLRARPPATDL
jgi:hypothetical protein